MHKALCLGLAALLAIATVSPASAQPDAWAEARLLNARGEALFDAGNYGAALAEFRVAYQQLEGHPRRFAVLSNLAACHERMFQYDIAITFYTDYLRQGGELIENRSAVEERVRSLEQLLATLTIHSNVPAEVWIDDRRVGQAPGVIRLSPGKHLIELRAPLYEASRRELDFAAGSVRQLKFELHKLSQYSGLDPAYFWTFAGLTVAAVGVGIGFGVAALDGDAAGRRAVERDPYLKTPEDEQAVRSAANAADVAFIGAAVLGASATILFFLTDWDGQSEKERATVQPFAGGELRAWQVGVRGAL